MPCELNCIRTIFHLYSMSITEISINGILLTSAEAEATYEQIKQYCREQFDLNVSTLYISQIKRKYGIIERECYNKSKNADARVPQCPPEKERAITAALQHFKMI